MQHNRHLRLLSKNCPEIQAQNIKLFQSLLLSEKWARLHGVPFPKIADKVEELLDKPGQEVYVFKDKDVPATEVPVIIFITLLNKDFKKFLAPGVPRTKEEDIKFAAFSIFDDGTYNIGRFVYSELDIDRLTGLVEFTLAKYLDVIHHEIGEIVSQKRNVKDEDTKL